MIDSKKIEQIARQIHEAMPKGIRDFGEDVEKKIRQTLQAQLARLDLVSREEFDVQIQVLLRTREKLTALEQRINQIENRGGAGTTTMSAAASDPAVVQPGAATSPAATPTIPPVEAKP